MQNARIEECTCPDLAERYDVALREAVAFTLGRFPETVAIAAAGTIVRGSPSASSDLDLYVIHEAAYQQRLQYVFSGVPAEIFVNPEVQVRTYLGREQRHGRPIAAHMLATGFPVLDTTGALEPVFSFRRLFVPRPKDLLARLAEIDPDLHELVIAYLREPDAGRAVEIAGEIAERVAGVRGFFEWESAPRTIEDAEGPTQPDGPRLRPDGRCRARSRPRRVDAGATGREEASAPR
jgi:hypothetical protein